MGLGLDHGPGPGLDHGPGPGPGPWARAGPGPLLFAAGPGPGPLLLRVFFRPQTDFFKKNDFSKKNRGEILCKGAPELNSNICSRYDSSRIFVFVFLLTF